MRSDLKKRILFKTLSWRFIGTIDTILLSWIITGNIVFGLKIGATEIFTKMILYFFHERIWLRINLDKNNEIIISRKRDLIKTFSWRGIGTLDTVIISWVITGNPFTGFKIGLTEIITKMILFYIHERFWNRIDYGLKEIKN